MSSRVAMVAVLGVLVAILAPTIADGAWTVSGSAVSLTAASPVPTVAPTATVPLPDAGQLLSRAVSSSRAHGSVVEFGTIRSSDNGIFDGRSFWANFSWKKHRYRDHSFYRRPTNLNAAIHSARDVRRIVAGPWIAIRAHKHWYCGKTSTQANRSYWERPSFALVAPRTLGQVTVRGQQAWEIEGGFTEKTSHSSSRLTVDVFVAESNNLLLRVVEHGSVHINHHGAATIRGQLDYKKYGSLSTIFVPPVCKS